MTVVRNLELYASVITSAFVKLLISIFVRTDKNSKPDTLHTLTVIRLGFVRVVILWRGWGVNLTPLLPSSYFKKN